MPNLGSVNGSGLNDAGVSARTFSTASPAPDAPYVSIDSKDEAGRKPDANWEGLAHFRFADGPIAHFVEFEIAALTGTISFFTDHIITGVFVIEETGIIQAPVEFDVTGVGQVGLDTEFAVFDPSYYFDFSVRNAFRWSAIVTIAPEGGDRPGESGDISEYLTGTISVEAEESAARLADFTREPRPIGPCPTETDPEFLDLTKHVGRAVTIDYVLKDALGAILDTQRIFTGTINEVIYDPVTRLSTYTCTDGRQVLLENLDRPSIDALMPGSWYSSFAFDEEANNLEYAEDRLSTVPFALDLDRFGVWQFAQFVSQPSGEYKFNGTNTIYNSLSVNIETWRNITTEIELTCDYRFTRLRERLTTFGWTFPGSFCDYLDSGFTLPRKQMIVSAANGSSWRLTSVNFENMPPTTVYTCGGSPRFWLNDGSKFAPLFTLDASGTIAKRFSNTIKENYVLTIQAPSSQTQFGVIKDTLSFSVDPDFDARDWLNEGASVDEAEIERDPNVPSTSQSVAIGDFGYDFSVNGTDKYYDLIGDEIIAGDGRREDWENAVQTMIQVGKVQLIQSHRRNEVGWRTPLVPEIELYHTLEIDTCPVNARGKVKAFSHEMNMETGEAVTQITVAISRSSVPSGPETPTSVPAIPDTVSGMGSGSTSIGLGKRWGGQQPGSVFTYSHPPVPSPPIDSEPFNGYTGNREPQDVGSQIYPIQFQIITEEIDQADNEDIEAEELATYDVFIPDDLLNMQA